MKKILISALGILAGATMMQAQDSVPAKKITPATEAKSPAQKSQAKSTTPAGWVDDMAAAKAKAKKEGKALLIDFSGSDWCIWCQRLDAEIFSKKEFLSEAAKKYVLVFIDSPRSAKLPDKTAKQNRSLVEQYKIQGFPTVIIADADGVTLAQTGYRKASPQEYIKHLEDITKTSRAVKKLEAEIKDMKKGPERAKKIHAVVSTFPFDAQRENAVLIMEIVDTDADGKLGIRDKYPFFVVVKPLQDKFMEIANSVDTEMRKIMLEANDEERRSNEFVQKNLKKVFSEKMALVNELDAEIKSAKEKLNSEQKQYLSELELAVKQAKSFAEGE